VKNVVKHLEAVGIKEHSSGLTDSKDPEMPVIHIILKRVHCYFPGLNSGSFFPPELSGFIKLHHASNGVPMVRPILAMTWQMWLVRKAVCHDWMTFEEIARTTLQHLQHPISRPPQSIAPSHCHSEGQ
jgi:hypothetical protein